MSEDDWQARAACAGSTGWDIDCGRSPEAKRARRICLTGCPVLAECRAWAGQYRWSGVVVAGHAMAGPSFAHLPNRAPSKSRDAA